MSREEEIRTIVERFLARVRQDVDARLATLATDLFDAISGRDDIGRVALERAAVDMARAASRGGQARNDLMARIMSLVRRLDDASSLRGILDILAEGVASDTAAAAIFIVNAGALQTYRHHGFEAGRVPADIALDQSPLLTNVVAFRQAASVAAVGPVPDPRLPAFLAVPAGRVGLAIPLAVGKEVVAVVYVEGAERGAGEAGEPVWTAAVEVLVRHAAARLENVTSLRTVEVLSSS